MEKPNRLSFHNMEGIDNPHLVVAWDKKNQIISEFEVRNGNMLPEVMNELDKNMNKSSKEFWNSWEEQAKKNRI